VLKEHGIEIDTPFYWQPEKFSQHEGYYLCAKDGFIHGLTCALDFTEATVTTEVLPAYPLTEVLGWLPNVVTIKKIPCNLEPMDAKSGKYRYLGTTHWDVEQTKFLSIEDLIIQGLTEGWLTKETILNAIKDNAK
jgi:hypothetical protein